MVTYTHKLMSLHHHHLCDQGYFVSYDTNEVCERIQAEIPLKQSETFICENLEINRGKNEVTQLAQTSQNIDFRFTQFTSSARSVIP